MKTKTKTFRLFSRRGKYGIASIAFLASIAALPVLVWGAPNTQLSQSIASSALATDIKTAAGVSVPNPSVAMSSVAYPFTCLTGTERPVGTLGDTVTDELVYVDNPGAVTVGNWTLSVAATGGATSVWENGTATQSYDYNDPTTGGCGDGADTDTVSGQMTVDMSSASFNAVSGTTTGISLGSTNSFSEGVTDSITLMSADPTADDFGRYTLQDVLLRQTIPQEQAADNYTLDLTLSVVAS